MMVFGFLLLLLVVAVLVVGVIAGLSWLNRTNRQGDPYRMNQPSEIREQVPIQDPKRFCSHCGAGLQEGWTHCPQCGASIGS